MQKKLMTDTFEIKGIWFLPGRSMDKDGVEGILRYSPQEIILELIGIFSNVDPFYNMETPLRLIIYGFSDCGEWYTLFDCITVNAQMSAPGFDTVSYIVNRFYVGNRIIEDEDYSLIEDATFSLTNLDAWLNYNIIQYRSNKRRTEYILDFDSPHFDKKKINIQSKDLILNEEFSCKIGFPKEFFLEEKTEIMIRRFYCLSSATENLLSPRSALDSIQQLRRLLVLIIGNAMYFSYIEFNCSSIKEEAFGGQEVKQKHYCRMFFNQVGDIFKAQRLSPHKPNSILLKRNDLKENMEYVFNRWFKEQDKLSEIIGAYISDLYLPAYIASKFLNVVRGLETYHRFFVEINEKNQELKQQSKSELNRGREQILAFINDTVTEENRDYFINRICFEDEQSFRKRLKELLGLAPAKLSSGLFGELSSKEKNKLISTIIDTRNYYTHRDDKMKYANVVSDHMTLNTLTRQLSTLLQFFCLTHIGVDSDVVEQRLLKRM